MRPWLPVGAISDLSVGYEPKAGPVNPMKKNPRSDGARRKATQQELRDGEDEIRRAHQRFEEERMKGTELPIEDAKEEVVAMEVKAEAPEVIPKEEGRVEAFTPRTVTHSIATPRSLRPSGIDAEAQVSAPTGSGNAAIRPLEIRDGPLEGSGGPMQEATGSGDRREEMMKPSSKEAADHQSGPLPPPMTESPMLPLFDEGQLRRFQELYQQAPLIYAHRNEGPLPLMDQPANPPLRRPLFLEQEDRRVPDEQNRQGVGQGWNVEAGNERESMKMMLQQLAMENQMLKIRLERVEMMRGEEEPKFATPNGSEGNKGGSAKEAVDPQPGGSARPPKAPEDVKEAADPLPGGSGRPPSRSYPGSVVPKGGEDRMMTPGIPFASMWHPATRGSVLTKEAVDPPPGGLERPPEAEGRKEEAADPPPRGGRDPQKEKEDQPKDGQQTPCSRSWKACN